MLVNGRLVTAPGKVIERGTIVVRDGRIAAVGAQVSAPADLQRIDLNGQALVAFRVTGTAQLSITRTGTRT